MNLRDKKGSIAIFVLIALLFMASFLIIMFSGNINKSKIVKEQIDIIKNIYGKNLDKAGEIYGKVAAVPEITLEISQKTGGVMNIIITSNGMTDELEVEEYKFNGETKYSKEELYKYIEKENLYDVEKELEIIIINDIKNKTEFKETVKFVKPTINELPSQIIVGSTEILETYVEYDEMGGTTEYIAFNESFSTINELINFVIDNNEYKEVEIKINAKGNNNLNATSTQNVTFEQASEPIIKTLPNPIWVNVTTVDDSYVVYNHTDVAEETYTIVKDNDNKTFNTMTELVDYIATTNNEPQLITDIKIVAKGKNNLSSEGTQTITFKKPLEPVIGTIPSPIITNITPVSDSYVTYDDKGKREETYTITLKINDTNITFSGSTMSDAVSTVDRWLLENNNRPYEVNADVKIVATGVTNLSSESTQNIKFIRGVKVANESEFSTALASTSPSYIQLANNIACSNTISVDGVTHKLDLNNQNISYTLSSTASEATYTFITLGSNTNLTVIDSSSEKQGSIVAEISEEAASDDINREATVISINNRGELNIESGKIGAKVTRIITEGDKGLGVHDTGVGIQNSGTINLKGGTVYSDVVTQAFGKGAVQISEATAIGIENSGIINSTSGNIDVKAEARYLKNGWVYGRKFAYAYDIVNPSGTINNSENINFVYSATAINDDTVYEAKTRSGEIVTKIDKY